LQAGEDGVADLAFERAQRFFAGFAFGQFLVVVGTALGVPVADLGDRGHADRVAVPAVAAAGQPAGPFRPPDGRLTVSFSGPVRRLRPGGR
jgi:hypothetical protein